MNSLRITGRVVECQPLRYTPAGIPVLEMVLDHCSEVLEAEGLRKVAFSISAIAMGDVARMLADIPLGTSVRIEGFLASVRKGSKRLRVHVQQAALLTVGTADHPEGSNANTA